MKRTSISPTDGSKLKQQMAAGAGKKESVSLSLFLEVNDLELEEEPSTMATLFWTEAVWMNRWRRGQQKVWRKQIFEVQTWKQVRGLAGAVMRETRDLGIMWPHWHTSLFEGPGGGGYELALPAGCEEDAI